jgi:type IV pilus assembly protein PilV
VKNTRIKKRILFSCRSTQQGFILIDAMIAVLIFSIGIIGMVSLQSAAVKLAGDAKYRTDAAMLADQVIAQMWTSDPTQLVNAYSSSTAGAAYTAWLTTVDCTQAAASSTTCLPGVAANPPTIVIVPMALPTETSGGTELQVTVTVSWKAPNDTGPHNYVSISDIGT